MRESPEVRLKRLRMRSMRRGIREMDMLLATYADAKLAGMTPAQLDLYEALLEEGDQDLLAWVTGLRPVPQRFADLIEQIVQGATAEEGNRI